MKTDPLLSMFTQAQLEEHIKDANSGGNYEHWKQIRSFITQAIHRDGTFLDVGCANGFLMQCLLHWSERRLIPYGVDNRPEAIQKAKLLLPNYQENFQCLDGDHLEKLREVGLPLQYDFVYRNYWKRDLATQEQVQAIVTKLLDHIRPEGRLLLGLYWGSDHPTGSALHKTSQQSFLKFVELIKSGTNRIDGEAFSESGFHWIMWMNKDTNA